MERTAHLGTSALILFGFGILPICWIFIPIAYIKARYGTGPKEWLEKYGKVAGVILILQIYIIVTPATEEIVFRAPLMLLFPSLTKTVWVAVIISSLVFGALHATKNWINRGNLSGMPGVVESSQGIGWRIWRFSITTILGFILAYQAVLHQSLYRCFWIHLCWNVFFMLIFPLLLRFLIPLVCNAWMAITGRNFQRSRYF